MVYDIIYVDKTNKNKSLVLYDIDVWLKTRGDIFKDGKYTQRREWCTELECATNSANIAKFVYDTIHDEKILKEFMADSEKIDWLRGFLHEELKNYWREYEQAKKMFMEIYIPEIENVIYNFSNKYGLIVKK